MKWKLRRLFLGDRRKTDRVIEDTKQALKRLDQALSTWVSEDKQRNTNPDER